MRPRRTAAVLCAIAAAACASEPAPPAAPEADRPSSRSVPWAIARDASGLALLDAPATVVGPADAEASIGPPARTRVEKVHVQVGDPVEAGQAVAEVVMPEIVEAAGRLAAAKIRIEAQSRQRQRLLALQEHGLARTADLAEAETALAQARAERTAALAILQGAGLSEDDAQAMLDRRGSVTLRSPIAGVVLSIQAPIGSIHEGGGEPLVRIGAATSGRVVARTSVSLPEGASFVWLSPGRPPIPLELRASSPLVDPRDGSREHFFEPAEPIPPGLAGKVRILLPEGTRLTAIPARALFLRDGRAFVYAQAPEGVREVEVRVLSSSGSEALVEGLEPGAKVAADAGRYAASRATEAP